MKIEGAIRDERFDLWCAAECPHLGFDDEGNPNCARLGKLDWCDFAVAMCGAKGVENAKNITEAREFVEKEYWGEQGD